MKTKQDSTEVKALVEQTNPGKTAEELLSVYNGQEDKLIKNLKKMKPQQDAGQVANLVDLTNPGKSSTELLAAYEGREDE